MAFKERKSCVLIVTSNLSDDTTKREIFFLKNQTLRIINSSSNITNIITDTTATHQKNEELDYNDPEQLKTFKNKKKTSQTVIEVSRMLIKTCYTLWYCIVFSGANASLGPSER